MATIATLKMYEYELSTSTYIWIPLILGLNSKIAGLANVHE